MPNDIDELFSRIDADPTITTPGDIDKIIAWYRQQRAAKQAGGSKAKRETGPVAKIDLASLGLSAKPATPSDFKRRV